LWAPPTTPAKGRVAFHEESASTTLLISTCISSVDCGPILEKDVLIVGKTRVVDASNTTKLLSLEVIAEAGQPKERNSGGRLNYVCIQ
jgi:hypothetical protein